MEYLLQYYHRHGRCCYSHECTNKTVMKTVTVSDEIGNYGNDWEQANHMIVIFF